MKRFKYILFIGFSETVCPFRFLVCGRGFLYKILILIITLNLFSCFVRTNKSSAWTAGIYAEGKDLGTSSVMIGVASEARSTPADLTDQNSVTLNLITPENEPLSEDIREECNMRYTWIIFVNPMGNIVPLDPIRTATLRWDFSSLSKVGTFELWYGTDETGSIVVQDMITTKSYLVEGLRYFTVVFTEADEPNYNYYYRDSDDDGYGDPKDSKYACKQPEGYVLSDSTDCNDADSDINPGAIDVYDGIDNNCDGEVDEDFYFWGNLIATGQYYDGNTQTADVIFGLDSNSPLGLASKISDPNNWSQDNIVRLQLIDPEADISDPNTFTDSDYLITDIRIASGQTQIAWYVMVEIGDEADPNQPDYYPVLSWDPNNLGATEEIYGNEYVYQLIRGLGESGEVLVENMADANTNFYETGSQDGDPIQYFTILWTQKPEEPEEEEKPRSSKQILPWPGVYPRALSWGGTPFAVGFPGGVPYTLSSGYQPGLSIPSFPGTYTGFTYPGVMYPAWTTFVPRFPMTFPTLGLFAPIGKGWSTNYWTGYPQSGFYQTGWFYQY